jgi:hypothetical protein
MDREREEYFEQCFSELCKGREDHEFVHFNRSMGIQIHGKEHYKHEMKKRGMVPLDEAERLAEKWDKENPRKEYDTLSPKALDIITSLKMSADKDGNITLGNVAINALQKLGVIGKSLEHAPTTFTGQGGFSG